MRKSKKDIRRENNSYVRGSTGISIIGKRKLQNLIKRFNENAKKKVEVKTIKGQWDGYCYPILDKTISMSAIRQMKKSKKLSKEKNFKELENATVSQESIIESEFEDEFNKYYPSAPEGTAYSIIRQYTSQGRRASREMINRMYALVVAYTRHNYTDYDNYDTSDNESRVALRRSKNDSVRSIINEWQKK